ncbi:LacI family DNA-binding transcriptional regulator [Pseudoduganella sp. UC29_106]|uniref:LacI family DNA-binding transcriptional regulator n=1 Tax=Pseudoduganella sp. UC29_106 TaxID=3374553 RepID=UPI0037580048
MPAKYPDTIPHAAQGKLASISAVAEHAGVSIATVSRVLNKTKAVNDDTGRASKLPWQPWAIAPTRWPAA